MLLQLLNTFSIKLSQKIKCKIIYKDKCKINEKGVYKAVDII